MYQEDVTLQGMMDGVRRSNIFLLILVSRFEGHFACFYIHLDKIN